MTSPAVAVTSFGYLHGPAPDAEITLDVRNNLRDPHPDPVMRGLTGLDTRVRHHVLRTPGALVLVAHVVLLTRDLVELPTSQGGTFRIAIGCAGGRHRSVVLASEIAETLKVAGVVQLTHRDVHRPVVNR